MGMKASDYSVIPLCRRCHDFYHSKDGERGRALERMYGISFDQIAARLHEKYLASHPTPLVST
jgi:hypothetical protein